MKVELNSRQMPSNHDIVKEKIIVICFMHGYSVIQKKFMSMGMTDVLLKIK